MLCPDQWPDLKALPSNDAEPLEWALFYHSLGLWVYPIRDAKDREEYREHLVAKYMKGGQDEAAAKDRAAKKVDRSRKHTFVPWREHTTRPSKRQIKAWWTGRPERGIALLTGKDRGFSVIDIDTAKGGVAAPWIGPGVVCLAKTPSGGYHAWHLEIDEAGAEGLDVGLDVRATGNLVAAPAGRAQPGRIFERFGPPTPFPAAALDLLRSKIERLRKVESHSAKSIIVDEGEAELYVPKAADVSEDRSFTHALSTHAPDGTKNPRCKAIVGMLARSAPVPNDGVEAAITTLRRWTRQQLGKVRLTADLDRSLEDGWRAQLKASTRGVEFAITIVRAWNEVWCSPAWDDGTAEDKARDLWTTATRKEEQRTQEQSATEEEADYRLFAPSLGSLYTVDEYEKDSSKVLLSCSALPPWQDINGEPDHSHEHGHGWGPWLDEALGGGIGPEYFVMLGAKNAKVGKTGWLDQIVDGLTLRSLLVLSGAMSGPLVVPYMLTELSARDLTHRQLARFFGVDNNVWRRGAERAHEAPGLRRMAKALGRDARVLADEFHSRGRDALRSDGIFAQLRELRTVLQPRELMSAHDHDPEAKGPPIDHRRGVYLLRACADTMAWDRDRKAKQWGVDPTTIWPLLFIDPVHRFMRRGRGDAVDSLDEFVEEIRNGLCVEHGFIVFATADTNKESAKGAGRKGAAPAEAAAAAFRGSQNALHLPDAALLLESKWSDDLTKAPHSAEITLGMSRWSQPTNKPFVYTYVPECGRFLAQPPLDQKPVIVDDGTEDKVDKPSKPKGRPKQSRSGGKFGKVVVVEDDA